MMDERRRRLLGPLADDADARGEHHYPDEPAPTRVEGGEGLTREPSQYVAGAEGTQRITTPAPADAPADSS